MTPGEARVIAITGIPGSGKTTLAGALAKRTGRLLVTSHEIVERVDPEALARGDMADPEKMRIAFLDKMTEVGDAPLILDGWPRSIDQAEALPDDVVIILLSCIPSAAVARQLLRGREYDTPEIVAKRTREQAVSMSGWAFQLCGPERTIDTSAITPGWVLEAVLAYLDGKTQAIYEWKREVAGGSPVTSSAN